MIPDFKTYLKESVWGDIRKKSLGQEERKEFDVNNFTIKEFADYLSKQYTPLSFYMIYYVEVTNCISIPVGLCANPTPDNSKNKSCFYLFYSPDDNIVYANNNIQEDIIKTLKDNYKHRPFAGDQATGFFPDDGKKIDNQFCIDIINFTLKYIDTLGGSVETLIKKKGVNESVWGDLRKKSLGREERIEDDINYLNLWDFADYLRDLYEDPIVIDYKNQGNKTVSVLILRKRLTRGDPRCDISLVINKEHDEFDLRVVISNADGREGFVDRLKQEYTAELLFNKTYQVYKVYPKSKQVEINNSFIVKLIDYIATIGDPDDEVMIKRKQV